MPSHRLPALAAAVLATTLIACTTDAPVEPSLSLAPDGLSYEIEDGAHGGNAHFFFLPPLVPAPSFSGTPDPSLLGSLAVEVCDLGTTRPPANESCGSSPVFIARFTSTTGTGSEVLRYDAGSAQYIANWHTDKSDGGTLQTSRYYRLRVLVASTVLGQADIDPVRSANDLKNYDTGNSIPLVNGRTLPIKFRLEVGAVFKIGKAGGVAKTPDDRAKVVIPTDAVAADVGVTVEAAPLPPADLAGAGIVGGTSFDLGPDGTQFASAVTVTLAYDPTQLPTGTDEADLRLYTLANGRWHLIAGSSVDAAGNTVSGGTSHFSVYSVGIRAASTAFEPAWLPLAPGATAQLEAVSRDPDGNVLENRDATWTSSAPGAASVDANGLVTGESRGLALVSASVEGKSDTVNVLVETPSMVADKLAWQGRRDAEGSVYLLGADGVTVRRITNATPRGGDASWSADGRQVYFTNDRDGNEEIYVMAPDGLEVRRLTSHPHFDREPDVSPSGSQVAFVSGRTGNFEIFVMDSSGSNPVNVSNHGGFDAEPDWSPSGELLLFNSCRAPSCDIYRMNANGTDLRQLTTHLTNDGQASWSPDGSQIAWTTDRDGNFEIYVMDSLGQNQTRLTTHQALDQMPAWSPDGLRIAFMSQRDGNSEIYLMDEDGTNQVRLTANGAEDVRPVWASDGLSILFTSNRSLFANQLFRLDLQSGETHLVQNNPIQAQEPDWSPDGSKLAFTSQRTGNFELYTINADGSNLTNVTNDGGFDAEAHWSPDGAKLTFSSCRTGSCEIFVMNADGSGVQQLTEHPTNDGQSNWSPDGQDLTWTTDRDGNFDIYRMHADGTGTVRLTSSGALDQMPEWSPDGTRIVFMSERDGNQEIYFMNADGSGQTRLTAHPGIDTRPSWSPDGTHIAFNSSRDGDFKVFVMDADGSNVTRITNHSAGEGYPTWRR